MTPGEPQLRLALARAMLTSQLVPDPVAVRAATFLSRRALEHEVAARLERDLPGSQRGSFRAQLLCVRSLEPVAGSDAAQLHAELSHACHQHPYELSPTVDEAKSLVERTVQVLGRLATP